VEDVAVPVEGVDGVDLELESRTWPHALPR
jgi:hypothetical protein